MSTGAEPRVTSAGWRLLGRTLTAQRWGISLGIAVGLAWTAGKVAVPQLTQLAIDQGIAQRGSLWLWSGLIVAAGVVAGLFTSWRRYLAFRESRLTETRLRERLVAHLIHLHVGYHDRVQTGQLMSRASSDLQQVQGFVVMIPLTVSNVALVVVVTVLLVASQPLLAVIALSPLPFVNLLANRFSRRIHPAVLAVQAEQAQLATVVEESVTGVRVVKGFGAEAVQARKVRAKADDIRDASLRAARIRSAFMPGLDLLPALGLIAVLGIGGHLVIDGSMTVGELVKFHAYLAMLIMPLRIVGMTVAMGQRAAVALQRVEEVLRVQCEVTDPAEPIPLPPVGGRAVGHVRFRDVTFGYDPARPVLRGFDLEIGAGRSVALVGATGSGKSTVARLLVRFYDVQRGSVELDGVDVRHLRLQDLRRAVGIVFEDTFLFNDSVAANIAFARPDADRRDIERAARAAGAHDFICDLPDGYDTVVGERGCALSGGQRQRIALARAVLADPRVLVLDDATSAVDASTEHEIRVAMAEVMRGRTTIVIAHRPGTIALADEVVLLADGRVAARGQHDELVATVPEYRRVLAALAVRDHESHEAPIQIDAAAVVMARPVGADDGGVA